MKVEIAWDLMQVGDSFFLPCIDMQETADVLRSQAVYKGYIVWMQEEIHNKRLGLRVWRIE